ncbi:MAG: TPM domain-containing protein [Verrucomicrobiota bacterium]
MRTPQFLHRLRHKEITQAIRKAEGKSSGQIRVFVQRGEVVDDPLLRAEKRFLQLGMHKTRERNAVLIWVAPRAHKFAIVGDIAVHEKCGSEFWHRLVATMQGHFRDEHFSRAIIYGINETGKKLATHFPRTSETINELPDDIARG